MAQPVRWLLVAAVAFAPLGCGSRAWRLALVWAGGAALVAHAAYHAPSRVALDPEAVVMRRYLSLIP